jgi:arginase family enzyme
MVTVQAQERRVGPAESDISLSFESAPHNALVEVSRLMDGSYKVKLYPSSDIDLVSRGGDGIFRIGTGTPSERTLSESELIESMGSFRGDSMYCGMDHHELTQLTDQIESARYRRTH